MAYGVDKHPNPPEYPAGHIELEREDGEIVRRWVSDEEDGDE